MCDACPPYNVLLAVLSSDNNILAALRLSTTARITLPIYIVSHEDTFYNTLRTRTAHYRTWGSQREYVLWAFFISPPSPSNTRAIEKLFPDTTVGFHWFLVFDTPILLSNESIDASPYDLVWGASDRILPMYRETNPNIVTSLYIPWSRYAYCWTRLFSLVLICLQGQRWYPRLGLLESNSSRLGVVQVRSSDTSIPIHWSPYAFRHQQSRRCWYGHIFFKVEAFD